MPKPPLPLAKTPSPGRAPVSGYAAPPAPTPPTRTGYSFLGWNLKRSNVVDQENLLSNKSESESESSGQTFVVSTDGELEKFSVNLYALDPYPDKVIAKLYDSV